MPNTYFQFKQFTIHQEQCAMKVCTDACLFGAWVAESIERNAIKPTQILDIGTGTGLLSLMLAQSTNATIDAIELDENAASQARQNFEASPWHEQLKIIKGDARQIDPGKKYGLIISNPPFFENDLRSHDHQRNLALHSSELSLEELLVVTKQNLSTNGNFAVLLPYHRKNEMIELAKAHGFFLLEATDVQQTPKHPFFRTLFLFGTSGQATHHTNITIRENDGYSDAFNHLLQAYYLHL